MSRVDRYREVLVQALCKPEGSPEQKIAIEEMTNLIMNELTREEIAQVKVIQKAAWAALEEAVTEQGRKNGPQ